MAEKTLMRMRSWLTSFFFLTGCLSAAVAQSATASSVRDADAACSECHQKIFQSYLPTPMANASGLAAERAVAGSFQHASSGVDYRVTLDPDGPHLSYRFPGDPPVAGSLKLDYFLGSGHLGITYLYSINHFLFESPIAYYNKLNAYDMKPGLAKSPTMPPGLALNDACLRCHMSGVQRADAGTDNRFSKLPFLHVGITCESCHGDTSKHVASRGKSPLTDLADLTPEKRDSVCVLCHLEGDTNVERRGRSILDFQPGDDISTYLDYFAYAGENTTIRAVSEIEQFSSSRCKMVSGPTMSCTTCHDPHSSPDAGERTAYFRAKCLTCHAQPEYAAHHHAENPDCTSCHMPKTGSKNIQHVAWTDHRIRKTPDAFDSGQAAPPSTTVVPILSHDSSQRDLGLAYYNLVIKGKAFAKDRARQLLMAANFSDPGDIAVLRALGVLSEMDKENSAAEQFYRAILKIDPSNLTATTNLGVLVAKAGDLQGAATLWQSAFRNNEDIVGLGTNLATAQCLLGDKEHAVETLKLVLTYSPDLRGIRGRLASIEAGRQHCPSE